MPPPPPPPLPAASTAAAKAVASPSRLACTAPNSAREMAPSPSPSCRRTIRPAVCREKTMPPLPRAACTSDATMRPDPDVLTALKAASRSTGCMG